MNVFQLAKIMFTIIAFVIISLKDIKTREIDPKVWIIVIPPILVLTLINVLFASVNVSDLIMYAIGVGIVSLIAVLFYYIGLFGGADMFAMIALSLAVPLSNYTIIFNQLLIILIAGLVGLLTIPVLLAYNIIHENWNKLPSNTRLFEKIVLLATAIPVKVTDYVEGKYKFFYPLTVYECNYKDTILTIRYSFNVDEEVNEHITKLNKCIELGKITPNRDYLWITYGMPFIVNLTLAYILVVLFNPGKIFYVFVK